MIWFMIISVIIILVMVNLVLATVVKDILNITWLNRLSLFPPFGIIIMVLLSIVMLIMFMIDTVKDNWG